MINPVLAASLRASIPPDLVDLLLETYSELKNNFSLSKYRPSEVEGGRFAETVFRILEFRTTGASTPLGTPLNTDRIINHLSQIPAASQVDSIRLHIPRTLRVIYDIRNKRDAAHLADGIDANLQDSTFVVAAADWIMAEILRLYHGSHPTDAQQQISDLVTKQVPTVQVIAGSYKTLRPDFTLPERILVLTYHIGSIGTDFTTLANSVKPSQRGNLKATLSRMIHDQDFIFEKDGVYYITRRGISETENRKLLSHK